MLVGKVVDEHLIDDLSRGAFFPRIGLGMTRRVDPVERVEEAAERPGESSQVILAIGAVAVGSPSIQRYTDHGQD